MSHRTILHTLITGAAASLLAAQVATANPFASCLTNAVDTNSVRWISFRLNQDLGTNDTCLILSGGGTVTNVLQAAPSPTNLVRGLIVTNLEIGPGPFKVYVKHLGTGTFAPMGPTVAFGSPRGIAVNNVVNSPYFGWIYVANSATNASNKGDGMFALTADMGDPLGQGLAPKTGGYNFGTGGASAPYHCSVTPEGNVLVTDWSDTAGGVIQMDPTLSSYTYVLPQIVGSAATPVGTANNHGSIMSAFIVGTGADRKLYTMDEDYQTDPTQGSLTENNSAWVYNIGTSAFPYASAPNRKIMTPYLVGFAGQNQKCEVYGHYLYSNQRRSNPPQHDVYVTDLDNLQDPSTWSGSTPWDTIWTSQDTSKGMGYSDDILRDAMTFAVSPDQKYMAVIIAAGSSTITAPDGGSYSTTANDIYLIPMTNGIPNLAAWQRYRYGGAAFGRDVAFDAAHNIYMVSSGLGYAQALDLGESTEITTGSDGTFVFATPPTLVSVTATTPTASEQGAVPGVITFTRTPDAITNAVTIFYNISGTASNGADYVQITNAVTIPAGQTSVDVNITPIDDTITEPTETVSITLRGAGGYSVGFPVSATVYIADNETPQLRVVSLSANMFQGVDNDYAAIRLQRWGDTNVPVTLDTSSFVMGGTAVRNVDYYFTNLPYVLTPGTWDVTFPLLRPTKASTNIGTLSILLTNVAGTGYVVTNNTASTVLTLQAVPTGNVLFSDNFEGDSSVNWNVFFQSYTNGSTDFTYDFGFNYTDPTAAAAKNLTPLPPAPHSTNNDFKGLYMTVNKNAGVSAGLNLYLKNRTFSGSYALRFDLFLVENSVSTAQSKVEDVLFGINHDGAHTNWFRNAVTGTSLPATPTASDGVFFDIGADANGGGGAPYDFAAWSGPTWTNTVNVVGPTNFIQRAASTLRDIFKKPPYNPVTVAGGSPVNTVLNSTPTWAQVEISQLQTAVGYIITYKINNSVIFAFTNAAPYQAAAYTNGTVMLGYCDPWDDLGNGSPTSGEGCAVIDNVQVVQLSTPVLTLQPTNTLADAGASATFAVAATTVTGVTNYQWFTNGVAIPNATSATLTINPVGFGNYVTYQVRVDDGTYLTWSTNATLRPATVPAVLTPPTSLAAVVGGSATFTVTPGTYSGVTNYQWYYYGTNAGATLLAGKYAARARNLALTNLQTVSFGGPYTVTISDGFTTVTSTPAATLTYAVSPQITAPGYSAGNFSFTFGTELGPSYVVDFKSALTNAAWVPIKTNAGSGSPINISTPAAGTQGYYRVRMQ